MSTKTSLSKGVGIVTVIALFGLVLGSSVVPTVSQVDAADMLLASVAITASPSTICAGQATVIAWSSTDATSLSIDQGIGSVLPFGNRSVSPAQTTTYTITGSNSTGGFATASATVYVSASCATPTPNPTPYPTPNPVLSCSPTPVTVQSGQDVTLYTTNGFGSYSWNAPEGTPSNGTTSSFTTRFYNNANYTRSYFVTVTGYNSNWGTQSANCEVRVTGYANPTPYPYPTPYQYLQCSPSYTTVDAGDRVRFDAWGGDGSYSWRAYDGSPSSGRGSSFTTRFYNDNYNYNYDNGNYNYDSYGNYQYNNYNYPPYSRTSTVTVTSAGQTATCTVYVNGNSPTPTPTPYYADFSMDHTVRNTTRGGQGSSVTAYNGDHLQFTTVIRNGNRRAEDVHIRDWLPAYLTYVSGSTRVNNSYTNDGIATGRTNDSLALNDISANRNMTVTFEAILNGAPTTVLTNSVNVHIRGANDQNRTSTISVVGSYYAYPTPTYYPTPYVTPSANVRAALTVLGRNKSRGQTGEYTSVQARSDETLDLIIRVRSTNGSYLSNATVTDILPAGLSYIARSTTLNGSEVGDGITSSGINVGTVSPNTDTLVKFSVRVDGAYVPTTGTVVIQDTAQMRADGLGTMSAQLPIGLGQNLNLAAISSVQTGPSDSLWLTLIVALLATGAYALYTRTTRFGRRAAIAEVNRLSRNSGLNFSK